MPERETVTVIMTAQNAAPFLSSSLGSITAQSRLPEQIVFVDDGSEDDTWACAQALLSRVPGVELIRLPPTGRGGALNAAVDRASATWVANVDADDWVTPNWLEVAIPAISMVDDLAVLGVTSQLFKREHDLKHVRWYQEGNAAVRDVTRVAAYRNPICHTAVLMRRSAIIEVGGYDEQRDSLFDYDLWVRLINAGWRLGKLEARLCAHREHDSQSFERHHRYKYVVSSLHVQGRAIRALNAPVSAYLLAGGRAAWGFLPREFRRAILGSYRS